MSIDAARMQEVFKHLKIKKNWEEVEELYNNWSDQYKHDRYQNMSYIELQQVSNIFCFKTNVIYKQRNQFVDFLAKNKEFYNDNLEIVIQRLIKKRDELAVRYGYACRYINWYPDFGGMLYDPRIMRNREYEWRSNNNIPYSQYVSNESVVEIPLNSPEQSDSENQSNQSVFG